MTNAIFEETDNVSKIEYIKEEIKLAFVIVYYNVISLHTGVYLLLNLEMFPKRENYDSQVL